MTVGLKLGSIIDEIGEQDFFYSFFSTVAYRLEKGEWGSRFPCLLKNLYQGNLEQKDAEQALDELNIITVELSKVSPNKVSPNKVIWDIENINKHPPWGSNISCDITDLSNYFITSTGRDLISVLRECLEELRDHGGLLEILSI